MNFIDIVILVILIIGFVLGYKDGFIRKITGFVGLIIAIILSIQFSDSLAVLISPYLKNELYFAKIISIIVIFISAILLFSIIKRILHPSDKINKLVNQIFGGIIGIVQIVFLVSGILLFFRIFQLPEEETRKQSIFYNSIYQVIPSTLELIFGNNSNIKDFLKNKIESEDII